jgi:demethylmenaquinone methyltransferase/2-methoxy-6-polyprenyl-1,4-benzoquinol methylase
MSPASKNGQAIQEMFSEVAPRYDLLNHLLSASLDRVWRRKAATLLSEAGPEPLLDLCCGTGDQALALARSSSCVLAADFCVPMLALARQKYAGGNGAAPRGLAADTLVLPFPDGRFAGVTVSFGLRNVAALGTALNEIRRVLKPGGQLVVLEFALPRAPIIKTAYRFYFHHVLPRIGRLISLSEGAYQYLPDSVTNFPQRDEMTRRMIEAGFSSATWKDLAAGVVCLYEARG